MRIVNELTDRQIEQLHTLYQNEWWSKGRSLEDTKTCVIHSQLIIGMIDADSNLVGFSRVLTDTVFKALIFDVMVVETHRGTGLGKQLLNAIKSHEKLKNVRHFELYCKPEMIPFYESHAFNCDVGDIQFMRLSNSN